MKTDQTEQELLDALFELQALLINRGLTESEAMWLNRCFHRSATLLSRREARNKSLR